MQVSVLCRVENLSSIVSTECGFPSNSALRHGNFYFFIIFLIKPLTVSTIQG